MTSLLRRAGFRPPAPRRDQLEDRILFQAHEKQDILARDVFSGIYNYILFGGAIRGGKTYGVLAILIVLCKVFPGSRWCVLRRDLPTLRRNTLPVFRKIRPAHFISDVNYTTWTATCNNGSEILFMSESFKEDPDLDRFKGMEVNGFVPEEMNELQEVTWYKMVERAGSWIIPPFYKEVPELTPSGRPTGRMTSELVHPIQPPRLIIGTCNPSPGWVKQLFYVPWKEGTLQPPYHFIESLTEDNPHNPKEYVQGLKTSLRDQERKRFLEGNWEVSAHPDQLIRAEWLMNLDEPPEMEEDDPASHRLGIDVAHKGADLCTLAHLFKNTILNIEEISDKSRKKAMAFARTVRNRIRLIGLPHENVRIDGIGFGATTADILEEWGIIITQIIAGAAPVIPPGERARLRRARRKSNTTGMVKWARRGNDNPDNHYEVRFANIRAQMWWQYARKLEAGIVTVDPKFYNTKLWWKLVEELTAVHFHESSERVISIDSRDDIIERIGRSPDLATAVVQAAFDFPAEAAQDSSEDNVSRSINVITRRG